MESILEKLQKSGLVTVKKISASSCCTQKSSYAMVNNPDKEELSEKTATDGYDNKKPREILSIKIFSFKFICKKINSIIFYSWTKNCNRFEDFPETI